MDPNNQPFALALDFDLTLGILKNRNDVDGPYTINKRLLPFMYFMQTEGLPFGIATSKTLYFLYQEVLQIQRKIEKTRLIHYWQETLNKDYGLKLNFIYTPYDAFNDDGIEIEKFGKEKITRGIHYYTDVYKSAEHDLESGKPKSEKTNMMEREDWNFYQRYNLGENNLGKICQLHAVKKNFAAKIICLLDDTAKHPNALKNNKENFIGILHDYWNTSPKWIDALDKQMEQATDGISIKKFIQSIQQLNQQVIRNIYGEKFEIKLMAALLFLKQKDQNMFDVFLNKCHNKKLLTVSITKNTTEDALIKLCTQQAKHHDFIFAMSFNEVVTYSDAGQLKFNKALLPTLHSLQKRGIPIGIVTNQSFHQLQEKPPQFQKQTLGYWIKEIQQTYGIELTFVSTSFDTGNTSNTIFGQKKYIDTYLEAEKRLIKDPTFLESDEFKRQLKKDSEIADGIYFKQRHLGKKAQLQQQMSNYNVSRAVYLDSQKKHIAAHQESKNIKAIQVGSDDWLDKLQKTISSEPLTNETHQAPTIFQM